jgi:SH3 domain-containing YSC84-like protein 1
MKRKSWPMPGIVVAALVLLVAGTGVFFTVPALADDSMDARHLTEKARITVETFGKAPEMEGFRELMKTAKGIFIAPQIIKGAFIVGAAGGSGVFAARDNKTGRWMGPAFYTIGEASFGFQIGGQASEVVLLAMSERGVASLLASSVKLGADIGVAAGPVGMGAAAATANFSADIVSFSRSKGLYGGLSLDGAIVKTRADWNDAYYGARVSPSDILVLKKVQSPHASTLLDELSRLASGK